MDFWGFTTSFLCAIHCAALPLLFSLGIISSHTWMGHPLFELSMISLTTIFVYSSLIKGFFKNKVNKFSFIVSIIGLLLILLHSIVPAHNTLIVVIGGILVALAHIANIIIGKHLFLSSTASVN